MLSWNEFFYIFNLLSDRSSQVMNSPIVFVSAVLVILCPHQSHTKNECALGPEMDGKACENGRKHGDLYPDLWSCRRFYQCFRGITRLKICPGNLHFNADTRACSLPKNARCIKTCPAEGHRKQAPALEDYDECKGGPYLNGKSCGGHKHGDLYRDPWDCTSFYHCAWNVTHHKKCPGKLQFNVIIKVCDWPKDARCVETCPAPGQSYPSADPVIEDKCGKNSEDLDGKPCESGRKHGDFYPDPWNCNRYYQCTRGIQYLKYCPRKFHFNDNVHACDSPKNARCIRTCPTPK